jgi:hypothetical protein
MRYAGIPQMKAAQLLFGPQLFRGGSHLLAALMGKEASNLSVAMVSGLTVEGQRQLRLPKETRPVGSKIRARPDGTRR